MNQACRDLSQCPEIWNYICFVREHPDQVCNEQKLLIFCVVKAFETEEIYVDLEQMRKYMLNQKYFPYQLFNWEKFCFALHCCTYWLDTGDPRWPTLRIFVGRGSGKNGYLAFEDFCLITPTNGIEKYNIDIYATCEDQAAQTFNDLYDILESRADFFKNYFYWNKTVIRNLKTKSEIRFHTRAANSKDGKRPGKNDYDEVHAYENYDLIDTTETGLGKVEHPRTTCISSNGDVRDGPFDDYVKDGQDMLNGIIPDNGILNFFCWVESDDEIKDESKWIKAIPSLHDFPTLRKEIQKEFFDYQRDPYKHLSFASKRMNRPRKETADSICAFEDLIKACEDPEVEYGRKAIIGIDFVLINDFAAAGFLSKNSDGSVYWDTHSWYCKNSADLPRINPGVIKEAEARGLLTCVDDVEISPDVITEWITARIAEKGYKVQFVCVDTFRYSVLKRALEAIGFKSGKLGNIFLTRTSDVIRVTPLILRYLTKCLIFWGSGNMLMRWYAWNCKKVLKNGNVTIEKQDYKKRKTDGWYALMHAFTKFESLDAAGIAAIPDVNTTIRPKADTERRKTGAFRAIRRR